MNKPYRHPVLFLALIGLVATITMGCDEKYVNSKQDAENYAKDHPNIPAYKIFVQDGQGKEVSLEDMRIQEQADKQKQEAKTPEPTAASTQPTSDDQSGEVLKYEDTTTTTVKTPIEIFNNGNINGVDNNGTPITIKFDKPTHISELTDYHWNYGKGKEPGTISLKDEGGKTYGPWQATSALGQGGVPNAYWIITPNIDLPAGSYTVVDSDPATWSQNDGTGGKGMVWAKGWFE
jgi:hypothetical protein